MQAWGVTGVILLLCLIRVSRPDIRHGGRLLEDSAESPCEDMNHDGVNSFLWTIKRNPPSYFFGTIHVPYAKVWRFVADNAKEAFRRSQRVYFELELTDPATVSRLSSCQLLPRGALLADVIPRRLYQRLQRHLHHVRMMLPSWTDERWRWRRRRTYAHHLFNAIAGDWRRKRPVWVMLLVNALTEAEVRSRDVPVFDLYLAQEAKRMGKRTGAIERVEEQCLPLNRLNFTQAVFALNQTLYEHEQYRQGDGPMPHTATSLIHHYNCGDLNSALFNNDTTVSRSVNVSTWQQYTIKQIDEYFHDELIHRRNRRIASRVKRLLNAYPNESFFFAFGAGHFLGNNTILDEMRASGFTVEHTLPMEPLSHGNAHTSQPEQSPTLMADMPSHFPAAPLSDNLQYLDAFYDRRRHSHGDRYNRGRRKGRQRERAHSTAAPPKIDTPNFKDLWVRLDASRLHPDSYVRRQSVRDHSTGPYASHSGVRSTLTKPMLLGIILITSFIRPWAR